MITIEEFKKVQMVVGEIIQAEKVPGAEKLLRLIVDIGDEKRNLIAGIAKEYPPETLIGKKLIIVKNLQPAVIRGVESNGMILAADVEGRAVIPFFDREVPNGSIVR